MKLTTNQIKDITLGAAYIDSIDKKTRFHRFTKEQEDLYKTVSDNFYNKTFSNSCIRLEFETNSSSLFIKTEVTPRSSRTFYSHDVFTNGELLGTLSGNIVTNTSEIVSKKFDLGEKGKTKTVRICLPWSCSSDIIELSIDDRAYVAPIQKSRKMICFGDSITQGYDATFTNNSYASKITTYFNTETRNKGIGGEIFRPELAKLKDDGFEPNIITVAYGTNDWATEVSRDLFVNRINEFFESLTQNYPNAKIFIISPIWRSDWQDIHTFGTFSDIKEELLKVANKYQNVTLIDGFDFVPQNSKFFSDKYLHPNDEGFSYYAKTLIKKYVFQFKIQNSKFKIQNSKF